MIYLTRTFIFHFTSVFRDAREMLHADELPPGVSGLSIEVCRLAQEPHHCKV